MKITIIFEQFIVLMWKHLNFQLCCFCYSVGYVGSVFTEAQPGSTLTALSLKFQFHYGNIHISHQIFRQVGQASSDFTKQAYVVKYLIRVGRSKISPKTSDVICECSLLRIIVEREFQILTLMNFMNQWKSNVIFNDLHLLIRLYHISGNTSFYVFISENI